MTFAYYERLSLYLTLLIGILVIAFTGEISPAFWAPALAALGVGAYLHAASGRAAISSLTLPTLAAVAFAAADFLFLAPNFLVVVIDAVLVLLALKLLGGRRVADNLQMLGLSFLLVLGASVVTVDLNFGLLLLGYIFAGLTALVLQNLRGHWENAGGDPDALGRRRGLLGRAFGAAIAALGVGILLFTLVLYFAFPRVGIRLWSTSFSRETLVSGFSDTVSLNDLERIRSNPAIALRVDYPAGVPDEASPLRRLRGVVLSQYENNTWRAVNPLAATKLQPFYASGRRTWRRGTIQPTGALTVAPSEDYLSVLFAPQGAVQVRGSFARLWSTTSGYLRAERIAAASPEYEIGVSSAFSDEAPPIADDRQLPAAVSPRLRELAASWAPEEDGEALAAAFEARFKREFRYSTELTSAPGVDPLEQFLFTTKAGHCELYATAMTLLLRARGVPARVVNGFVGGEAWDERTVVFRELHAHSWVEAYFPGRGWVEFDPTPATPARLDLITQLRLVYYDVVGTVRYHWSRWFVGYDDAAQRETLRSLQSTSRKIGDRLDGVRGLWREAAGYGWAALAALAAAAAWALVRARRAGKVSTNRISRLYRRRLRAAEQVRGRRRGETPQAFAARVAAADPRWGRFSEYTELYYKLRYGDAKPEDGLRFLELDAHVPEKHAQPERA